MVNIDTHQRQQIISNSSYLPDNLCTSFSSSERYDEQINNTYLSKEIDERLTLLQSIIVTALPTEITLYNQEQKQHDSLVTELIIPTNLPFNNTEIPTNFFSTGYQQHSVTVSSDQKSDAINQQAIEKQIQISELVENQQICVKIKSTMLAKPLADDKLVSIETETVTKSLLNAGDTHLQNLSHKVIKEDDLWPTITNELNNTELVEQENCQSLTDSNNLANSDSASHFTNWPSLQVATNYQSDITAELPAKTATTTMPSNHSSPEAELRYTFTQWQGGTHHVDIYRIANHHLQLMASNSHVMSILQRHLNERASPSTVSLADTLNITLNNSDESGDESS